jgi:hypothetical protein
MSNNIWINIEIGGTLPISIIGALLETISDEIDNLSAPNSVDQVLECEGDVIQISGTSYNGLCPSLHKFCMEHNLPFKHTCDACEEYNPDETYWLPGMQYAMTFVTDNSADPIVKVSVIKPLLQFMLGVITEGLEALPKYLDYPNAAVQEFVKEGLENGKEALHKKLNDHIEKLTSMQSYEIPTLVIDYIS